MYTTLGNGEKKTINMFYSCRGIKELSHYNYKNAIPNKE